MYPESVPPFPLHESPIRVGVFDLGGVFIHVEMDKVFASLAKKFSLSEEAMRESVLDPVLLDLYQRGKISSKAFYRQIRDKLGHSFSFMSFYRAWVNIFTPNTEMIAFLHTIRPHFKLILLSNTNVLHIQFLERHYSFLQLFDHRIYSCDTGFLKPEPPMYQMAIEKANASPKECLFVDDTMANVEGAQRFGMQGFHFTDNTSFFQFWKERVDYSRLK